MALNFLNFNENKTEVVFGPCFTGQPFPIDISPLAQYIKPAGTAWGFRMDNQISALG